MDYLFQIFKVGASVENSPSFTMHQCSVIPTSPSKLNA